MIVHEIDKEFALGGAAPKSGAQKVLLALQPFGLHRLVKALLLLIEAVIADGIPSPLLYAWTVIALGLFFVGGYCIMLKE